MKKYIILVAYLILLAACGGSSEVDPMTTPIPQPNKAPSVPSLTAPSNGLLCTENPLDFSWSGSTDPEGDTISYYIQVATNNSFTENLQVLSTTGTTTHFTLKKGKAYYWRVNAKDAKNKSSSYTPVWKFYSEGEGISNHLPYAATLISPELNANITDDVTTLKWSSTDVDNDPLVYDIYVGTINPPPLVLENSTITTYDLTITEATTYYWKINVKDDAGGETEGQIWSFKKN